MKLHSYCSLSSILIILTDTTSSINGFNVHSSLVGKERLSVQHYIHHQRLSSLSSSTTTLYSQSTEDDTINLSSTNTSNDQIKRTISAAPLQNDSIEIKKDNTDTTTSSTNKSPSAKTNTVNERLMAELQAATEAEKGPKTAIGEKLKANFRYTEKTDEERQAALEAARDLNGVNPTVTILASFFAFGMAYGFWTATQFLGELFLSHPVSADAPYAFARMASVFRNVVMGLSSLASGFAAVSGLGVFLLGVRVAYGKSYIYIYIYCGVE
jgi:hypothetical protein